MSCEEHRVLERCGVDLSLDLAGLCADFYILESLSTAGRRDATDLLEAGETYVADSLDRYLRVVVGGELRHVRRKTDRLERHGLTRVWDSGVGRSRHAAWNQWNAFLTRVGHEGLRVAIDVFFDKSLWLRGFGGKKWGTAAEVAYDFERGAMSHRTFIDRCWTIQHNGGSIFNKGYDHATCDRLFTVLDTQSRRPYTHLMAWASPQVNNAFVEAMLDDHDPAWFGGNLTRREE